MLKAIGTGSSTKPFLKNVGHSDQEHLDSGSTYLVDPTQNFAFFAEILKNPLLSKEEKQRRLIDLSCIDFNEKDEKKSFQGRLIEGYVLLVNSLLGPIKEDQAEYVRVSVFNGKRFYAQMTPMQVVETIVAVLDRTSFALLGSRGGGSPYMQRTKVIVDLGDLAFELAGGCKVVLRGKAGNHKQEAWFFGGKVVTSKLKADVGLLIYLFMEKMKLVKTHSNKELGIPSVKAGHAGTRLYTEVKPLAIPPQHVTTTFPSMVELPDWYRDEKETMPYNRRSYKKRAPPSAPPSREGTVSRDRGFSVTIDGGASVEVEPLRFPFPIKEEYLYARRSDDFQLFVTNEHLSILNKLQGGPMRVNGQLLDYVIEWYEQLAENSLLQPMSLATRNIKAEIDKLREGLKGLSKKKKQEKELIKEIYKEIYRTRREHTQASSQWYVQRLTIGVATLFRYLRLYLPTSHDFRGRLYRGSILSPQSSTLARALMVFEHTAPVNCSNLPLFASHIGFAFKKFDTLAESSQWVAKNIREIIDLHRLLFYMEDGNRVDIASLEDPWRALSISLLLNSHRRDAGLSEKPLQSLVLQRDRNGLVLTNRLRRLVFTIGNETFYSFHTGIPFHYDATASAFQILGLMARDAVICRKCNIIPSPPGEGGRKRDLYAETAKEMTASKPPWEFTRAGVKQVFMPKSYGLTLYGMFPKIREAHPNTTDEEFKALIEIYEESWKKYFAKVNIIFKVFSSLGKTCACLNMPLSVCIHPRLWMVQRYRTYEMQKSRIPFEEETPTSAAGVKDTSPKSHQTRCRTLNIRVYDQDRGDIVKSGNSTAANLTHMVDGLVCTELVQLFFETHPKKEPPLLTNHDCFYTTLDHIEKIPPIYNRAVVRVMSAGLKGELVPDTAGTFPSEDRYVVEKMVFPALGEGIRAVQEREAVEKGIVAEMVDGILLPDPVTHVALKAGLRDIARKEAQQELLDRLDEWRRLPSQEAHLELLELLPRVVDKLPEEVQELVRDYIEYGEMVVNQEDLLPQVLESKFSVFP